MGEHGEFRRLSRSEERDYKLALLRDLEAFEHLLADGAFGANERHYGAELEMFLVDLTGAPSPTAPQVLEKLDARFTTELATYNLEANLPPEKIGGSFLSQLEHSLSDAFQTVREAAADEGARPLMTGILPTLTKQHLSADYMSPQARYAQLDRAVLERCGGVNRIRIEGIESFEHTFDSVMPEAANTSFQLHLQVTPEEFAPLYNLAQLISAPLLAAGTASPILCGRRLWFETRVALFEGSVDVRSVSQERRGAEPRVAFGRGWVNNSVLELLKENVSRYEPLLLSDETEDSMSALLAGELPSLHALALHNGTIWRWNRPCFGVAPSAHLRIENRVLPSGPTVTDSVANAAMFYGLMFGLAEGAAEIPQQLPFENAKENFLSAARYGLDASLTWLGGRRIDARSLILEQLLPRAEVGLSLLEVEESERLAWLDIVHRRVEGRATCSDWMLECFECFDKPVEAALWTARELASGAEKGIPVHAWPKPSKAESRPETVRDIMSTDLVTVSPEEIPTLVGSLMEWQEIRHVPVEDRHGRVHGVITPIALVKLLRDSGGSSLSAAEVVDSLPRVVRPELPASEALHILVNEKRTCLLVLEENRLIGIVTESDLLSYASAQLRGDDS